MAATKSSAGSLRKHVAADGRTTYTATVRARGYKSSTKTFSSKRDAIAWAEEKLEFLRKQRESVSPARGDVTRLSLADLILEYLKTPEAQAMRSYDGAHQMLSWFIQQCGTTRVLEANALLWRDAREKLQRGRKALTVNRYFICMRSCWNWGRSAGLVPIERRWPDRLMLPQPQGRTRYLSDDEIARLLVCAREHSVQMHTAVMVSISAGLRRGELLAMRWGDVDLARQTIAVPLNKTNRPRAVHVTGAGVEALKELQQAQKVRSITGAVFIGSDGERLRTSTLEARWRLIRSAAGLKDFRWHDLRHTTASVMAQAGASLLQIAEQLGHRSLAMVQRYSHLVAGAETPAHRALDAKLQPRQP